MISNELKKRLITGLALIAFLYLIFQLPYWHRYLFVLILWIYACLELVRSTPVNIYLKSLLIVTSVLIILVSGLIDFFNLDNFILGLLLSLNLLMGADFLFIRKKLRPNLLLVSVYLNVWLCPLMFINLLNSSASLNILWFYFLAIICHDIGGLIGGKLFGRLPLAPLISPNKTMEGLGFGFLLALLSCCVLFLFLDVSFSSTLYMTIFCFIGAMLGDLIMSGYKRYAKVKDFGNLLPGHGGLLDRIDSWLGAAPFACFFIQNL